MGEIKRKVVEVRLTAEEVLFAKAIMEGKSAFQAYVEAGYDGDSPSALREAWALFNDDRIIAHMTNATLDPANSTQHLTRREWLSRLTSLSIYGDKDADKLRALEMIGKAEGWLKPGGDDDDAGLASWITLAEREGIEAVPGHLRPEVERLMKKALTT